MLNKLGGWKRRWYGMLKKKLGVKNEMGVESIVHGLTKTLVQTWEIVIVFVKQNCSLDIVGLFRFVMNHGSTREIIQM